MTEFKEKGNAALKNKDYVQALAFYSEAVNAEPSNHLHYSNRSLCYFNLNKFQEAIDDASICIKLNPNWGKGYQRKGQAESKLDQIWQSFASYSYGNILDPSNDTIKQELQDIFQTVSSKFKSSLMSLMSNPSVQALMKDPSNLADLMNPTPEKIFEKGKKHPEFVNVITLILKVDKDTVEKDINHFFILKVKNDTPQKHETDELKDKFVQNKLAKGEEAFNKANDLFVFEEYESALAHYDIAITAEHTNIHYLLNRAACYLKLGDDVLALEDCNYALKKGIKSSRVYLLKALSYSNMNKLDLAKDANKEGLSLYPEDDKLLKQKETLFRVII